MCASLSFHLEVSELQTEHTESPDPLGTDLDVGCEGRIKFHSSTCRYPVSLTPFAEDSVLTV